MSSQSPSVLWLRITYLIGLLAWLPSIVSATGRADAILDQDTAVVGEDILLILQVAEQLSGIDPDLAPLHEDFNVTGMTSGTELRIVGGKLVAKSRWTLHIQPKRAGELSIPPLTIDRYQTPPLTLRVSAADPIDQAALPVKLETALQPQQPYVQSQLRLSLRLLHGAEVLNVVFPDVNIEQATVQRLGADLQHSTTRSGQRYDVIERRYAVFPETSGTLTIPALTIRGLIVSVSNSDSSRRRRYFERSSAVLNVTVKPRPSNYNGQHWLPSTKLSLEDEFDVTMARSGEPFNRTLILKAQGLSRYQLPQFRAVQIDRAKVYLGSSTVHSEADQDWVYSVVKQILMIVPTAPGPLIMPEIQLTWWDTVHNQPRIARLSTRTIQVLPTQSSAPLTGERDAPTPWLAKDATPYLWRWASGLILVLWLVTLLAWWYSHQRQSQRRV